MFACPVMSLGFWTHNFYHNVAANAEDYGGLKLFGRNCIFCSRG